MEIERKFLVAALPPGWETCPRRHLTQAYLAVHPTVRIRRDGDSYVLTCKGPGLLAREETEFPLTRSAFEHLLPKCDGRVLEKDRCRIPLGPYTAELDLFCGELSGLRYVEVEFPSVEEAEAFVPPAWFGREVTGDPRYTNAHLALDPSVTPQDLLP